MRAAFVRCTVLGLGLVLVGCAGEDLRQQAGPELTPETRIALTETVDTEANLDPALGLVLAQTSSRDECGFASDRPFGGQDTDPRQYTCTVLTARAYISGAGATPSTLAPQLDGSLLGRGCVLATEWIPPLDANPPETVFADARYTCKETNLYVTATTAQADIVDSAAGIAQLIASGGTGSPSREDPRLDFEALADQGTATDSAVVIVSAQAVYLDVQACGDLYLCDQQPSPIPD